MANPVLRLDTTFLDNSLPESSSAQGLTTPTTRSRARSISQAVLPSFRISTTPAADKSSAEYPSVPTSHGVNKARNESRKLLAHLLSQLQSRPVPPPLFDILTNGSSRKRTAASGQSARHSAKYPSQARELIPQDDSDSEWEDVITFNTDATLDLLNQLKDVLLISTAQKWDIFYDSPTDARRHSDRLSESYSHRRYHHAKRRSRSRSRSRSASITSDADGTMRAPNLLSQCVSVISSVILEDCRFKTSAPRPSRPPYALQSVTLDVAQFLIHEHRHDPRIFSQIAFAVIPAFYTFRTSMYTRLLSFFDDGVIGFVLHDLRRMQGRSSTEQPSDTRQADFLAPVAPPVVSITVDMAEDADVPPSSAFGWRRWKVSADVDYQSSNAPLQDVAVYQMSSVVSPLLAAILENVDIVSESLPTVHRFHRLMSRIAEYKPNAYSEVLQIIAYHSPRARYLAAGLLMSYWPRAVGHLAVTKAFPSITYSASLARTLQGPNHMRHPFDHPYAHQFVPWRFTSDAMPNVFGGSSHNECRSCSETIIGFGLLCPFCMCAVHFDCYDYPDGSFFTEYFLTAEPEVQKVAFFRFCHFHPQAREPLPASIVREEHAFGPVNLFSLTLCFICRTPLWGCVMQALKCQSCNQFVHAHCLHAASRSHAQLPRCRSVSIDDTYLTIEWSDLRRSFVEFYQDFSSTIADLSRRTYEEVSLLYAALWTQSELLRNGVVLGSILIIPESSQKPVSRDSRLDEFELHRLIKQCQDALSSGKLPVSGTLSDYFLDNKIRSPETSLFFNWNALTFIASTIKMPYEVAAVAASPSSDLLGVSQTDVFDSAAEGGSSYPFEAASLSHLRNQLGDQFQLFSEAAARFALTYLAHLGFFQLPDSLEDLSHHVHDPERQLCAFPLPLGLEVSAEVETLAAAIEACLSDFDLSVNEAGFLLLVRRFWPDGMMTDYALRRLAKAIVHWILSENNNLAIMLRDYVAQGRNLPGVRSGLESQPWPSSESRPTVANSANNGGDYVASRRALLHQYAARWMFALHNQDIEKYTATVFDLLEEHAAESEPGALLFSVKVADEVQSKRHLAVTDKVLRLILKVHQAGVVFTSYYDLFGKWLELASNVGHDEGPISSLSRLFNREIDSSQRSGSIYETRTTITDPSTVVPLNPVNVLVDTATRSKEGYQRTLHWLCLLVRAGVDVSVATFMQLVSLAKRFDVAVHECLLLVKAIMWSTWLRSVGREDMQAVVAVLHAHFATRIVARLQSKGGSLDMLTLIRQSLATCLLLYGCHRNYVSDLGMIHKEEIDGLMSRRKLPRTSTVSDPIIVDADLINALKLYVQAELDDVSCLVAKFLNAFVNDASLVEPYEVDNFILRNGSMLCMCMWQFYAIQVHDISTIRTSLLLRVLVVDAQPFQVLLEERFKADTSWELRLQAVMRLFRIILDVTTPAFHVEDRQWRSTVTDVFYQFFSSLWRDPREEVRLAVDTWSQTLLPVHFDAIAACWNESLAKSTIKERIKLISFLDQLRSHFSDWQVLSWDCIIETLLESDFMQRNGNDENGPAAAHLSMYGLTSQTPANYAVDMDPELSHLKISLLSLSMRMISDGIPIDIVSLLKVKDHVARVVGFEDVSMVPTASGHAFHVRFSGLDTIVQSADPCLNDLMTILDSSRAYEVPPSAMGGPYAEDDDPCNLLVGSVFVDIVLDLFIHAESIGTLSPTTLKNLLRSLIIIIHKHDFDSKPLIHLQGNLRRAVQRTMDLLFMNLSYELRQLALSACQAFIKRWPTIIGSFICDAIETATKLLVVLGYEQHGDDVLVEQTRVFLDTTLTVYSQSGVFNVLCKRDLPPEFFEVIRYVATANTKANKGSTTPECLRDDLLRDTLTKAIENDSETFKHVLENIATYVEVVHHSRYSSDMMQFVGLRLTQIARRTAEWPADAFDPNPPLLLACTLVQHNKAQSRDMLVYMETLLRAALVRFHVSAESLARIIRVTSVIYRKAAHTTEAGDVSNANPILLSMFELLSDGLHGKARISATTMTALVQTLSAAALDRGAGKPAILSEDAFFRLADDSLLFLYNDGNSDGLSMADFNAAQAVAKLALQAADLRPTILSKLSRAQATVRTWNTLVLAALASDSHSVASRVFDYFSTFSLAYARSLHSYQHTQQPIDTDAQETAHRDISNAYAALKLWLLLAQKAAVQRRELGVHIGGKGTDLEASVLDAEILMTGMVWNELWPPFESVMGAFEADAHAGNRSPLASTVWASVADLLLFLHQSRSVALDTSLETRTLNRLRNVVRGEAKLSRILRGMTEPPPDVPFEFFVKQVMTEIEAEEKLQAAKRQDTFSERGRRIAS